MTRARLSPALLLAAASLALAGCTQPAPTPTVTPTATADGTPTAIPTASATAVRDLVIPDCERLLPLELVRSVFSGSSEFLGEVSGEQAAGRFPIPEIAATVSGAHVLRSCVWGIPNSDGSVLVTAGQVTDEQRETLSAALLAAGFLDVSGAPVSAYHLEQEGIVSMDAATHLFSGRVWVMVDDAALGATDPLADAALAAIEAANP